MLRKLLIAGATALCVAGISLGGSVAPVSAAMPMYNSAPTHSAMPMHNMSMHSHHRWQKVCKTVWHHHHKLTICKWVRVHHWS